MMSSQIITVLEENAIEHRFNSYAIAYLNCNNVRMSLCYVTVDSDCIIVYNDNHGEGFICRIYMEDIDVFKADKLENCGVEGFV